MFEINHIVLKYSNNNYHFKINDWSHFNPIVALVQYDLFSFNHLKVCLKLEFKDQTQIREDKI